MKKIINTVAVIALLAACGTSTPKAVENSFADRFPGATGIEWEQDDDGAWEVEFTLEQKEYSASFSAAGDWLETEQKIELDEIPDTVLQVLALNYAGYEIDEAEKVESPDFSGYELALEKKGEPDMMTEITVGIDGQVLKEEGAAEDADDTDED